MSLEALRDKIAKKAKGTHVSVLSESEMATCKVNIPTPAYDLNRILSGSLFDGIPGRSFSLFVGPEASFKSSLACLFMANAQKQGYTPVIIDTEGAWNEEFVTRWGLDPKKMLYVYTPFVDKACVTLGQIIDSGDTNLALTVDSIGAMEIYKLIDDSIDGDLKADQGTLQKTQKRMLKMLQFIANSQNSMVICTGHFYGSPSQYSNADEVGGGKYMKLAPQIIISLKKSKMFENGDKSKVVGNAVKAITLKNRFYPPFNEAVVEIDYRKGINPYAGMLDLAIEAGLAEQGGAWYTINGKKYQGAVNAQEGLEQDKELLGKIDKWLENTGYSTVNENMAEAMKIMNENESELEKEFENEPVTIEEEVKKIKFNKKK